MKSRRILAIAAVALAVTLPAGPAPAGETPATATVDVTITVLPYAEVRFDEGTLPIDLVDSSGTFSAGGQVWCNCSVQLTAVVYPPPGATGTWTAITVPDTIEPGMHPYDDLLTISISDATPGYFSLELINTRLGEAPPLEQGQAIAIVTVMPQ